MKRFSYALTAACVLTVALAVPANAWQGKAKGHAKQEQKAKPGKPKPDKAQRGGKDRVDYPLGTSGDNMRFRGLDNNGDGVITRAEWRGSSQAFSQHDWNNDGVLRDEEVRPGAKRPGHGSLPGGDEDDAALFRGLDRDRNGVLSRNEWRESASEFARLDFDRNGVLSPYEFGVGR